MNKLLLIANYAYDNGYDELPGIITEIEVVKKTFKLMEYNISVLINSTYDEIKSTVEKYLSEITKEDTVVIYYTGHGCHWAGHNFIICRDSKKDVGRVTDVSFYELILKMYDLQNITSYSYKTDNVLLVSNACRKNETLCLRESELDNDTFEQKKVISQIHATSINAYAYDTPFFYETFCKACFRYMHSISDIYEFICSKKSCIRKEDLQNPVYIKGEIEFCISNTLNRYVEQEMYKDIIDIYVDYVLPVTKANRERSTFAVELYEEWFEIANVSGPKKYVTDIMDRYLLRPNRYGFIGCLMKLPVYSLVVKEEEFHVQGKNGCFIYKNCGLYDYNRCEKLFEDDGREVYRGIKLLSEHIFYINPYETSDTRWFELRIENAEKKALNLYFDNVSFLDNVFRAFEKKSSIMISASNRTDSIGFLRSLIYQCIVPEEKILFLRYMENICSNNELEQVFINEIWNDNFSAKMYKNRIGNGIYKWLLISLHSSLDAFTTREQILEVEKIVEVARANNIPIVFITNYLPEAIQIMPLTKRFYKYVECEIDLESNNSRENTYVSNFFKVKTCCDTTK